MIKKYLFITLTILLLINITGCAKYNSSMKIKKNKNLYYEISFGIDKELLGDNKLITKEEKAKIVKYGFNIEENNNNKFVGYTLSKKIKNIDSVSSNKSVIYRLTDLSNNDIYKVKKGFFKNKYTAHFIFDPTKDIFLQKKELYTHNIKDSNTIDDDIDELDDNEEEVNELDDDEEEVNELDDDEEDEDFFIDDTIDDDEEYEDEEDEEYYTSIDDNIENSELTEEKLNKKINNIDIQYKVNIPYSAINSNADIKNNSNKKLIWKLSSDKINYIEYEFELYNKNFIYLILSSLIVIISLIALLIVMKKMKRN